MRSRDGLLLPYKAAAVRIVAEGSGLPILPVVIDGTHVVADPPASARRMIGARGTLTIGQLIPAEVWKRPQAEDVIEEIWTWADKTVEGRLDVDVVANGLDAAPDVEGSARRRRGPGSSPIRQPANAKTSTTRRWSWRWRRGDHVADVDAATI